MDKRVRVELRLAAGRVRQAGDRLSGDASHLLLALGGARELLTSTPFEPECLRSV